MKILTSCFYLCDSKDMLILKLNCYPPLQCILGTLTWTTTTFTSWNWRPFSMEDITWNFMELHSKWVVWYAVLSHSWRCRLCSTHQTLPVFSEVTCLCCVWSRNIVGDISCLCCSWNNTHGDAYQLYSSTWCGFCYFSSFLETMWAYFLRKISHDDACLHMYDCFYNELFVQIICLDTVLRQIEAQCWKQSQHIGRTVWFLIMMPVGVFFTSVFRYQNPAWSH